MANKMDCENKLIRNITSDFLRLISRNNQAAAKHKRREDNSYNLHAAYVLDYLKFNSLDFYPSQTNA